MSKRIKILTPRIYEHSDFFHNAYDFARKKSLNTNELCLELSRYLVEHFDKVWKIERPRIYKQICNLQSQLQQANEIINNPDTLIFQQQQLIGNLQSQLAEKEEKIKDMKFMMRNTEQALNNVPNAMAGQRKRIDELTKELKQSEHNKISFAVEQLEQLKKLCQEKFNWWENSEWEGDIYDKSDVSNAYFDIEANVDNQIEELKKEMK